MTTFYCKRGVGGSNAGKGHWVKFCNLLFDQSENAGQVNKVYDRI